ncbi:MAG: response regulator [Gemmatimonadales bacterium]|nr:response regulator [Gemmatimonadales bacterium]
MSDDGSEAARDHAEQRRQSQKMEAMGRLAGGIAHDFNNILGMIVGFTELARSSARDRAPGMVSDLDEVLRAAERGKDLVERILRFSRPGQVVPEAIHLDTVVTDAVRLLRATIPASIDIRLRNEGYLPPVVGNATGVHHLLMNLANNAVHAMPEGGVLEVALEPFVADDAFVSAHPEIQEGSFVLLSIRDDGHGMDATTRQRAIDPFFTTKSAERGTGLGLSMALGVVREQGGTMWLDSEPGLGTTVCCLFPVSDDQSALRIDLPGAAPESRKMVMLVDDEPSLIRLGERRMQDLGYDVCGFTEPHVALEMFRERGSRIDLVITDYSMPRMNGIELAREFHRQRPEMPILLLTGYVEDFPLSALEASGIRRVLMKPITVAALADAVQGALVHR